MQPTRRDQLAAATLAKILGGELNAVDQSMLDGDPSKRANRIDMNTFIAPLLPQQQRQTPNPQFSYVPEELVQNMVPDVSIGSRPPSPDLIPMPAGYNANPPQHIPSPTIPIVSPKQHTVIQTNMDEVTKGNIASIATNLVMLRKDIAKFIGPLLTFLKFQTEEQDGILFAANARPKFPPNPLMSEGSSEGSSEINTRINKAVDEVRQEVAGGKNKKKE